MQNNRILYMDKFLAVFNKNSGEICESWTSKSAQPKDVYVPEVFLQSFEQKKDAPSFCQCFNRLDRPVSGANLLLFEKDLFPVLQNQFTNSQKGKKSVKKVYWAIVEGILPASESFEHLEHYIRFDALKQKAYVYNHNERKSKLAKLSWRSIGHGDNYSFLEIELLTGRTHQIRAQLAHIGMHIKGDVKYGAKRNDILGGIRLHAHLLEFSHPKTKETVSVKAPLPVVDPLWEAFMECLK